MKRFALALAAAPAAAQAADGHTAHQHGAAQAMPYSEPGETVEGGPDRHQRGRRHDGLEPSRIEAKAGGQIPFALRNADEFEYACLIPGHPKPA